MRYLVLGLLAVVGCGGSADAGAFVDDAGGGDSTAADGTTDSSTADTAATDSGGPDTPKTDTTPDLPPPPPVTLDNVCDKLADAVCGKPASTCCTKSGFGFDEAGCRDGVKAGCADRVDDVKAGDSVFDASAFPACVDAWAKLETACTVNLLEFLRTYPPCQQLFRGTTAPGDTCTDDVECAGPPGAFGTCTDAGTCVQLTIVGKDAPCNIAGDVRATCDLGLFCNVTGGGADPKGTCKAARKVGETCSFSRWFECGYGYVCQGGTGSSPKCAEGKPGGATCGGDWECASWQCASGRCSAANYPVASKGLCGG
ncbi:MAG: hypothetical protein JNL79_17305 [Myxococcales bacterium]|nr:hypothetical protein [Myxococcales bacterium]